nr:hypothetical protein [Bifidobacterium dentium]
MLVAGLGMLVFLQAMIVWSLIGGCAQGSRWSWRSLIAIRGQGGAETVVLSGIAQSFGYLIASLGPLVFGVLMQLTGGHQVSLGLFACMAFFQCVVAVIAGKTPKTR